MINVPFVFGNDHINCYMYVGFEKDKVGAGRLVGKLLL